MASGDVANTDRRRRPRKPLIAIYVSPQELAAFNALKATVAKQVPDITSTQLGRIALREFLDRYERRPLQLALEFRRPTQPKEGDNNG